jgi:putative aminopeptidase FrvX
MIVVPDALKTLLREVVSIPTAPYMEGEVRSYLREFAEEHSLDHAEDIYGNVYITYRRGRRKRPLVLGAHMDHPGFVVEEVQGRRLTLEFRGGISSEYGKGEKVALYREGERAPYARARISSIQQDERGRLTAATATLEGPTGRVAVNDLALWDVSICRIRGDLLQARACDDLAGAAAILATLERVASARRNGHLIGLFTRAEEVGLRGALVVGKERLLPEDALVVAVETSSFSNRRALQGGGPIVRVGDAAHVFSPGMTQWMTMLAQELAKEQREGFPYQRRLMDGGVTEATAYDLYGYETGAACIALGNYHNAGPHGRVRAENVHLRDLEGLVRLFERMHEKVPLFERSLPSLLKRYDQLGREAAPILKA